LLVGLYVLQTRWGSRECPSKKFSNIWPHCLTNATSLTSFGINPRFLSTSDLYDPVVAATNQTGLENSTLSSAPLFNDEGLPYGFVPPMDGLESYSLVFDINLHRVAATKRLQYLVDGFYFDNLTKSIEFALITYNADVNMFVLSKIHIEVDVGGKLGYTYRLVPIPVEPYSSASSYAQMVLEIIYVVCVAYNLLEEVNEMFQTYRHSGSFLHHFRQFGNWIDLLSLSIQVWGIVVWIIMVQQLSPLSDISVRYNVYTSLDDTTAQFWAVNTTNGGFERAMQVYRTMDDIINLRSFYFAIQGINVFLMVQRLLKLMDFQPRIGIITRTMAAALPAILHFFLVFGIIFLGFSFYGYLVFGRTLEQFRTIPNAMLSCFFMLIQDNSTAYYYAMLEGWERLAAFVFWLSFIVIMVFILMNVVIAIVVDAFMDVKEAAQEETALPIDIWILLRNLWQRICTPYWSLRKLRHHLLFLGTHEKTREEEEALAKQRKSALSEVARMLRKGCFQSQEERERMRRMHQTKRVVDVGIDMMDMTSLNALMTRTYERKMASMSPTKASKSSQVNPETIAESVMGQFGENVEVALLGEKPKKGKSGEMSHIKRSLQRLEENADETAYVLLQVQESLEKMRREQEELQQQQQLMLLRGSGKERRPELGLVRGGRQWSRVRRRFEDDDDGDDDDADVSAAAASRGWGGGGGSSNRGGFGGAAAGDSSGSGAGAGAAGAGGDGTGDTAVSGSTKGITHSSSAGEATLTALTRQFPRSISGMKGSLSFEQLAPTSPTRTPTLHTNSLPSHIIPGFMSRRRTDSALLPGSRQKPHVAGLTGGLSFSDGMRGGGAGAGRGGAADGIGGLSPIASVASGHMGFMGNGGMMSPAGSHSMGVGWAGHGAATGRGMGMGEFGNPGRQRRARMAHMKSFGGDEPSILDAVAKLGGGLGRMGGEEVGNTSGRHRPVGFGSMPRGAAEDLSMRRKMVDFPSMGAGMGTGMGMSAGWGMGEDVGNISGRRRALEYGSTRRGMPGGGMVGAGMASPYRGGGFLGSGTAGFAQPRSIMADGGFGNRKFGEGMGVGSRRMPGGEKQGNRASALLAELQAARAVGGAGSWTRIHEGEVKRVQVKGLMQREGGGDL
ncbi:unnamed protein product, partial [Closterium sp. NIES-53]